MFLVPAVIDMESEISVQVVLLAGAIPDVYSNNAKKYIATITKEKKSTPPICREASRIVFETEKINTKNSTYKNTKSPIKQVE